MTLLLLHALPLDERMWEPQRAAFPDAVTPRLYGRGSSMEGWARSILDEVEGEVVAVGASMGGYCALELVRRAPERVRAVVRTAASPAELPPAEELVAQIGELLGLAGAELGYEEALGLPDVRRIER